MTHDAARIVGDGDRIVDRFGEWQQQIEGTTRLEWAHELRLAELRQRVTRVLDLGAGADVETPQWVLARRRP